jgi:hypothetical protein
MGIISLLSGVTAPNGVPVAVKASGNITVVAGSGFVDGEYVQIFDGQTRKMFEFDLDGKARDPALNVALIPVTGLTADQVRDALIAAINGVTFKVTASSGGAALVNITHTEHGPNNHPLRDNVVNAGFDINGLGSGALSGVRVARDKSVLEDIWITSTGASPAAVITAKLWGYAYAAPVWSVIKTFGTLTLNGNNLAHNETLRQLEVPDLLYLELAGTFNGASVNSTITHKNQRGM